MAGTVFDNAKLPGAPWFQALYVRTRSRNHFSARELMRHPFMCCRAAWRVKHQLMQAMLQRDATRQLNDFAQMDDAYLGEYGVRLISPDAVNQPDLFVPRLPRFARATSPAQVSLLRRRCVHRQMRQSNLGHLAPTRLSRPLTPATK